jgi:hypothetical protein
MLEDLLKEFVIEAVSASPEYLAKERRRQKIQDSIVKLFKTKKISSQSELDEYLASLASDKKNELALTALRSVPFQVWQALAAKK